MRAGGAGAARRSTRGAWRRGLLAVVAAGAVLSGSAAAWAQSDGDGGADVDAADEMMEGGSLGGGERPWAKGVSAEDQAEARKLFDRGNDLLRESLFVQAVEYYRGALDYWDHPGIHFNLSLALLNLNEPIAVYRSLNKAIEYGAEPLEGDEQKLERAKSYLELVSGQIGTIELSCTQQGARVTLDGKPVLACPGEHRELVLVGAHQVVASKGGYLDQTHDIVLASKQTERIDLMLYSVDDLTISKRRWATWIPWSVVGAGVAVAAVGGVLHNQSKGGFETYDQDFDAVCMNGGCRDEEVPDLKSELDGAERTQTIAVATYALGGAVLVGGLVMAYINQPQVFRRDNEAQITWTPTVAPGSAGISAKVRF
ncbi:PEGA domain-containing protein [Haliangium ochraceum]|uniref:Uncharacterized protein n=1 Tax=Haliangium ochraceum (strain DSM 14365 / JCM 11303 / SMP-2) TaxID=502025 RepID=D0LSS4_HALO1|nr:PEGA domain-containing protein [Haliangium ochraceum]ACY17296.1 conserved hypothetical protein [Haliangium ochraceum DSM 14365]